MRSNVPTIKLNISRLSIYDKYFIIFKLFLLFEILITTFQPLFPSLQDLSHTPSLLLFNWWSKGVGTTARFQGIRNE